MNLRAARSEDADRLSALAFASKAHWGYPEAFMEQCRAELTYTPSDIERSNQWFTVIDKGTEVAGFYALQRLDAARVELEALFVAPSHIGEGLGRQLMDAAIAQARDLGFQTMIIQGDPHARGFYERIGAVCTGERASGSIPGRKLPVFRLQIADGR